MAIRPLVPEQDYERACERASDLMDAEPDTPELAELDALATLIEAYEEKLHRPIPPDPIEAIMFRLEQLGMTKKDLEPLIGSRARVSEVLNRKRYLSLTMIENLHEHLKIPAEVLIRQKRDKGRAKAAR